jgi:hypothetical protein
MAREVDWISTIVWLVLLGVAFIVGLMLVGQAFASNMPVLNDITLRVSADYSADPRAVQVAEVPVVNSAVISDTQRDLIVEQTPVPVLGLETVPTATLTPRPSRTPVLAFGRVASATPRPVIDASPTQGLFAPTATPTPAQPLGAPAAGRDRTDRNDRSRPTATPAGAPEPVSTVLPTATTRPTSTPTTPSTNTPVPTDTPEPPTNTPMPTNTPVPTDTPMPTNTPVPTDTPEPPTDTPLPTDTPEPPTDTPLPTDTPELPTDTPELPTDTPLPINLPLDLPLATPTGVVGD